MVNKTDYYGIKK